MPGDISEKLKTVRKFGFFTFGTTLAGFFIRLIKGVLFTRILGPTNRGIFGLLITLPQLVVSFGNLGLGLGNVYLVANRRYELRKIFGNTLVITFLLGTVLTFAGYFIFSQNWILKGNSETVRSYLPLILMAIPLVLLFEFSTDLIVAIQDIRFVNILTLAFSSFPIIFFLVVWLWTQNPLQSAVYAWFIGACFVCSWAVLRILRNTLFSIGFSKRYLWEAFSYGKRGFINIFANQLVLRVDFLFVSSMLGAKSLGYYAVSVSLAEILLSFPNAFNLPFLPVRLGMDKEKGSGDFTAVVIRHIFFVMVILCLLAAAAGKILIWILFGRRFLPAYPPLLWLLPGILALSVYNFLRSDFYSRNMPGFVSWVAVTALLSNIIFNLLLIPMCGIAGAALSSSISYGISTMLLLIKHKHMTGTFYQDLLMIKPSDLTTLWKKFALPRK